MKFSHLLLLYSSVALASLPPCGVNFISEEEAEGIDKDALDNHYT
jgi:hypothetical protein